MCVCLLLNCSVTVYVLCACSVVCGVCNVSCVPMCVWTCVCVSMVACITHTVISVSYSYSLSFYPTLFRASSLFLPPPSFFPFPSLTSSFFLRYKVTTEVVGAGAIEDAGLEGTEYEWEQVKWDPITGNLQCAIHFAFPDGSRLDDAFQYVLCLVVRVPFR